MPTGKKNGNTFSIQLQYKYSKIPLLHECNNFFLQITKTQVNLCEQIDNLLSLLVQGWANVTGKGFAQGFKDLACSPFTSFPYHLKNIHVK